MDVKKVEDEKKIDVKKQEEVKVEKPSIILDLVNIPQDIDTFIDNAKDETALYTIQNKYEKYYFSMWNKVKPRENSASVKWPFNTYTLGKSYGENLQLLKKEFFDEMLENSNFKNYATLNLKAITLSEVNLRAFPTCRPLLMNPNKEFQPLLKILALLRHIIAKEESLLIWLLRI